MAQFDTPVIAPAFGIRLHGVAPANHCEIVWSFAEYLSTLPNSVIEDHRYALGQILRDDAGVDEILHLEVCDNFPACLQPRVNRCDQGSYGDLQDGRYAELPECTFEQERYLTPYQLRALVPARLGTENERIRARLHPRPPFSSVSEPLQVPTFKQWLVAFRTEQTYSNDPQEWLFAADFARWARNRKDFPETVYTFRFLVQWLATVEGGDDQASSAGWAWAKYRGRNIGELVARGLLAQEASWAHE